MSVMTITQADVDAALALSWEQVRTQWREGIAKLDRAIRMYERMKRVDFAESTTWEFLHTAATQLRDRLERYLGLFAAQAGNVDPESATTVIEMSRILDFAEKAAPKD